MVVVYGPDYSSSLLSELVGRPAEVRWKGCPSVVFQDLDCVLVAGY